MAATEPGPQPSVDAVMMRYVDRTADTLWGDGFVDDGWAALAAVARWDDVHSDEYVRLFPALARHAGSPPSVVLDHLAEAVAVLTWRNHRRGGLRTAATDPTSAVVLRVGEAREACWFAAPPLWRMALERLGLLAPLGHSFGEAAAMVHLDAVLLACRGARPVPFNDAVAMTVAFHAALHPAYLWPEAVALADCAAAAGWLGLLARGRPALMPVDVALVLRDAVELRAPHTGRLRDARLSLCGFGSAQWAGLAHAARDRLSGRCAPVRLGAPPRRQPIRNGVVDATALPARAAPR